MKIDEFFPYRVAVLSEAISQCVAQVYRERFGLTRDEWRVLAALADEKWVKTTHVIEASTLEKMQVSRAVSRLAHDELLERQGDPEDGRGWLLRLSPRGKALYSKIVPMVQAREEFLLSALDATERSALDSALTKLQEQARQLIRNG